MDPYPTEPFHLSPQALNELKVIARKEHGDSMSDQEIEQMGMKLLELFDLLLPEEANTEPQTKPSEAEAPALKHVHQCIYHDKTEVTARGVAVAVGFKSSRSGWKLLQTLFDKGFISRDPNGAIVMRDDLASCDTPFSH